MKKIWILLMAVTLVACTPNEEVAVNETPNTVVIESESIKNQTNENTADLENEVVETEVIREGYQLISDQEAVNILSADDDYTIKLSEFDYASKFDADHALTLEERAQFYETVVLEWPKDKARAIDEAMVSIQPKLDELGIEIPDISFILTDQKDEGGAAYTRQNAIILKPYHIGSTTSDGLERLIVHEMFHVYSRYHKDQRPALYGIISYVECQELVVPEELENLTIANPDAPDNNYYIEGDYMGENYGFIPLIYSSEAYEIGSGQSFFRTLRDDMLAVNVQDGMATPVLIDDEIVIIKKEDVGGYYDKIGYNTDYTYHPEETIADNFVLLVFSDEVKSPFVIEGLKAVLQGE